MANRIEGEELLSLQEAADQLKVHYMTAYRWVRRGDLSAFKAGGRLRVRADDVTQFLRSREVDVALPGTGGRTDWDRHVDALHAQLASGELVQASALVRKIVADGAPAGEAYLQLLVPALHRIGEDWAAGRISVAEEHRATEICVRVMARLADAFRRRGPARGTAITLTPPEEQHAVGAAMAADFLRGTGYEVHHLGANVPLADLELFTETVPADLVCVSATTPPLPEDLLAGLAAAARSADARLIVGGQAAQRQAVEAAGAVYLADLAELPPLVIEAANT